MFHLVCNSGDEVFAVQDAHDTCLSCSASLTFEKALLRRGTVLCLLQHACSDAQSLPRASRMRNPPVPVTPPGCPITILADHQPRSPDQTISQLCQQLALHLDFNLAAHDVGVGDEVQYVDCGCHRLLLAGVLHQHPEHDHHAALGSDVSRHGRLLQHPEKHDSRDAVQVQETNVCA